MFMDRYVVMSHDSFWVLHVCVVVNYARTGATVDVNITYHALHLRAEVLERVVATVSAV